MTEEAQPSEPQSRPQSQRPLWFVPYLDESKPWRSRTRLPLKPDGVNLAIRDPNGKWIEYESEPAFEEAVKVRAELRQRKVAIPNYDRWFPAILLWEPREGSENHPPTAAIKPLLISLLLAWLYLSPPPQVAVWLGQMKMLLLLGVMFFGIMPLCSELIHIWEDWRDRAPDRNKRRQAEMVLFDDWLHSFSPLVLKGCVGLFAFIYGVQVFGGVPWMSVEKGLTALLVGGGGVMNSVLEAALVKSAVVNQGEWWRLLTAGVMHGSLLHFLFNGSALYFLGRVTIAMVGAPLLGLVFFASILGGSAASLWLSGGRPSVGSSGGVLGVLGFLTVILVLHRAGIPRLYKTNLVQAILIMSIFGALGAQFIDNAAHAGGFLVGGLLGIALVPRSDAVWEYRPPNWVKAVGWACWAGLASAGIYVAKLVLS